MGFVNFIIELLKDPRAAIASWIAMGVAPTLGFIFLIVFIETGVVFFPFLPGDSLLFAAGFFAAPDAATGAPGSLPLMFLLPVVWLAPIIGDQCNYFIGHFFGRRIIASGKVKAMTPERIAKTEGMIEKWGPLAVFLGRFFPFIRTFMPFISGISGMRWSRFTPFSILGGLTWSTLFTLLGYFFGGIPAVQEHFELVIVLILVISLLPTIIGLCKAKFGKKTPSETTDEQDVNPQDVTSAVADSELDRMETGLEQAQAADADITAARDTLHRTLDEREGSAR
ncbi:SNARE associated Golgi protein [Bifidobacterium sp. DSM 109958]|uniref:SNARE associated Golgi protein n=1 Tax=Bifidobacterium moraviense TaxID=2675323 RepID=A0A7Y0HYP6_9BIFI|nr:DedA family protein [Bifidobacterium sp. DSM 109958]NMN00607.1 SNARE associated Golgi protein [Bifidobacterium sp. DSM 109958]